MDENQECSTVTSCTNPEDPGSQVEAEQMIVGGVQSDDNPMETSASGGQEATQDAVETNAGQTESSEPVLLESSSNVEKEATEHHHESPEPAAVNPVPADQSEVVMESAQQPREEQSVEEKIEESKPEEPVVQEQENMNVQEEPEEAEEKSEPVAQLEQSEEVLAEVLSKEDEPEPVVQETLAAVDHHSEKALSPQNAEMEQERPAEELPSQPENISQSEQPIQKDELAQQTTAQQSSSAMDQTQEPAETKPIEEKPIAEPNEKEDQQLVVEAAVVENSTETTAEPTAPAVICSTEEARETQQNVSETIKVEHEEPKPAEEPEKAETEVSQNAATETQPSESKPQESQVNASEGFVLSQMSQVDVASAVAAAAAAETIAGQDEASSMFEDPLNAVMNEVIETAANAKNHDGESNMGAPGETAVARESEMDESTKMEPEADSESAVADVVAAVEKATAAAAAAGITSTPSTPKAVKKKPKSPIKSANTSISNHINNSILNSSGNNGEPMSPTSSQKRRKKDPSAPKAPLNGYLVYFNEERAEMKKVNPNIGFGELTKVIAAKWKDLPNELKQKYVNEAEFDKERYVKEMADYKKSDAFKQYQKEGSASKMFRFENGSGNLSENLNRSQNGSGGGITVNGPNMNWLQHEARIAGFDIPIFTEEFMDHCKTRENEMRQLRKEILEFEQQNGVLAKHIENMKQSVAKTESDAERYRNSNNLIQKHLDMFRQSIIHTLGNTPLPNTQEYPTAANIDDYIMKLMSIIGGNINNNGQMDNSQHHQFVNHVRNVFSRNNFNHLFELS